MAKQQNKDNCKVCKQIFNAKNPNLTMTDDDHMVIRCMASDVDSSDSCSERGQGHDTKGQAHSQTQGQTQGHRVADKVFKDKPLQRTRLSMKHKNVAELQCYDGDSSDTCSEKGHSQAQGIDYVKVKGQTLSPNLATKPPKVKSVKPLGGAKTHVDGKHLGCKPVISEKKPRSSRKIKLSPHENDNLEKEIQTKIANRSHLQHIIDEAMDHFQKLSSKSAPSPIHDKVKETKLSQGGKTDKVYKTVVDDNLKEVNVKDFESQETDSNRDKVNISSKELVSSGELDRTTTPDRPPSIESNISPSQRHLVSPNSENRISPNGSVSGSRRKLPQPPAHKLRCSVTSFVQSSVDSDSSRPNSSADYSDISESSSVTKGDTANNIGNIPTHKSAHENTNVVDNVLVKSVGVARTDESQKCKDINNVNDTKHDESYDITKDVEVAKHKSVHSHTTKQNDFDRSNISGNSIGRLSVNENVHLVEETDGVRIKILCEIGCVELESKVEAPSNKPIDNLDMLDISAASSSDVSTSESLETSDSLSAIDKSNCESGKENELIPLKHKHVSRSPSYRKKVMAKARSRYHRQLKELKCKTGECNGNCSLCGSETVPRSQTSLGLPVESISEEEYLEQSSPRRAYTPEPSTTPLARSPSSGQRSMKRVPVSSRVDVLMSNNLFKKHLTKHEDLLQKHTLSYRKFGLQKAVSNLDLSQGFMFDEISTSESLQDGENQEETMLNSSLNMTSSKLKHSSRRYSLTGENEFPDFNNVQGLDQGNEEKKTPLSKSHATNSAIPSLDEYRANLKCRQTQAPSFAEFRHNRSQKRRILPSNKIIRNLENDSSQVTDKDNQNESAIASTSKDRSSDGQESEVSEITVSLGHLDTIAESSLQANDPEAAISKHVQKSENKNSENQESVINDRSVEVLDTKQADRDASENNTNVESNTSAVKSSLENSEKLDSICVSESLNVDDKSPFSTSELDSAEINLPRRILSETDSVCSEDVSCSDLSSSEIASNISATKERHRKGAKRPRSLISKKSSLVSLIKESEQKELPAAQIANRQTVRRGNSLNSFLKGDSKHISHDGSEKERADSFRSVKLEGHDGSEKERADSFRSVKSEGHGHKKHDKNVERQSLRIKAEHSLDHTKGSHSAGMEGGNSVRFSLENDVQSEASQEMRETESEVASEVASVASESLHSEVCFSNCNLL